MCSFWGKPHQYSLFSSYNINTIWYQHDLSLIILTMITWSRMHWPGFSNVTFPPLLYSTLWKQVTKSNPHSKRVEGVKLLQEEEYLHKLLGIFCMRDLPLLFPFIYSLIYISDSRVCTLYLGYQYYVIYFVSQNVPTLAVGRYISLVPMSLWQDPISFVFWVLPYFLALQDDPGSSCISTLQS